MALLSPQALRAPLLLRSFTFSLVLASTIYLGTFLQCDGAPIISLDKTISQIDNDIVENLKKITYYSSQTISRECKE